MALYLALLLLAVILLLYHFYSREQFATSREKAEKIFDWFNSTTSPTYLGYKAALNEKSNIVEYEDVLRLLQSKNLTVPSIEKII